MQSIALPFRHHMNPFLSRMEQRTQRFSTHPYNDPLDKKLRISQLFLLFLGVFCMAQDRVGTTF